ncbi:hypothetical protein Dsin_009116 [Dipteronia sinensis]|uniref:Uncharacterized protein n=1 Tax=Dipteronia sinensis TaxID=43782 RepID=A0AAE0AQ01_9ROSI|nr:hypothetical protein Dsin_009116 [Dipteronia sinensis]
MGFPSSPPHSPTHSPTHSPDDSRYFKSMGELFRKYPLLDTASKSKSHSFNASVSRKDKGPASSSDRYKPALYPSLQKTTYSTIGSDSITVSSTISHLLIESPFDLSSTTKGLDLTQVFMASHAEPSHKTYESPNEGSTGPTPIVEEPPEAFPTQPIQVPKSKPTNGTWFQLDDSSPDSWRKKISEMSAWLDLQMEKSEQNLEAILREFVSQFTGFLRDWYQALGEYRQLQFARSLSTSHAIGILFREFLGDPDQYYK